MKEQSHKEEMSAALRGDFERLRERGVSPALVPQDTAEPDESPNGPEPEPELEAAVDPSAEPSLEPPAEPSLEPVEIPAAPPAEPPGEPVDEEPPRRGWLSRLAGR